jgi:hypothetical protein
MERINKFKEKAEYFLQNDVRAFIKDSSNNFYFCDILVIGETHLLVNNFAGNRIGEKTQILWFDIEVFSEYQERGDL